ncbi:MAG TPA: hypothetical protein VK982_07265, partial [Bacteroidales bacterium]|nr:hypothetical protein [Bacteroidales bacterium]
KPAAGIYTGLMHAMPRHADVQYAKLVMIKLRYRTTVIAYLIENIFNRIQIRPNIASIKDKPERPVFDRNRHIAGIHDFRAGARNIINKSMYYPFRV